MIDCQKCRTLLIDFHEENLEERIASDISEHLKNCGECQKIYQEFVKVGLLLDQDKITLPLDDWFESLKRKIRQETPDIKARYYLKWIPVPIAIAAIIILFFLFPRRTGSVEMDIPTSYLLEDNEIAARTLKELIDADLIADLEGFEQWELENNEFIIDDMNREEKEDLIREINELYSIDI